MPKPPKTAESAPAPAAVTKDRANLIHAIRTPLSFLVLGFLVVDGTVATLALTLGDDYRAPLVWTVILSVPGFALLVVGMAMLRPEALRGDRPLDHLYGRQFASDLFIALDGSLQNLETAERQEAWIMVADVITTGDATDGAYKRFCSEVAANLRRIANLPRVPRSHGPAA